MKERRESEYERHRIIIVGVEGGKTKESEESFLSELLHEGDTFLQDCTTLKSFTLDILAYGNFPVWEFS